MSKSAYSAPAEEVKSEYFRYLCDLANVNAEKNSYYLLANTLHKKHFYSIIPNDDNRIGDGKALRTRFVQNSEYIDYESIDGPCTFLEFLIGLAIRMSFTLEDTDDDAYIGKYFHELLENCGLSEASDDNYYSTDFDQDMVDAILDKILERRYKKDGFGGLFPIKTWTKNDQDQRKVEIWYQMSRYLNEKTD